jgi:1-deoxy-D-xylulose-5-phosphate reductoisomerase
MPSSKPPLRLVILGSTGSIGKSTLEVVRRYPDRFRVVGLSTNRKIDLLAQQIHEFSPEMVSVGDRASRESIQGLFSGLPVTEGASGLQELAGMDADVVVCGIVGAAGLLPVIRAIDAGRRIALANKEPLVMAGRLVMEHARRCGAEILPVDSEHNAVFQCLHGHRMEEVCCIHLTASGGPFYNKPRESLADVSPEQAASHPTWDMGAKISVDSATLMNKGLEIIEAKWLFGLPLEKIDVVIHPQSIVHSLVEFTDGSILAQLGVTDMKFPILFALTWPDRVPVAMERLDLARMGSLSFAKPDFREFPCLQLALEAARAGGTAPAVLNAANEVAVEAFCRNAIGFLHISEIVKRVLNAMPVEEDSDFDTILAIDAAARRMAWDAVEALGAHTR